MSVRVKRAVADLLGPSGVLSLRGRLRARSTLLLLGYHRIVPLPPGRTHPGDIELVSATPEEFAWQLEYLARRFEPVTFAQIADALTGVGSLPRRAVAVTFDDGFQDLYEHAWPALRHAGLPATVFVSTGYVDNGAPFWFDLVAYVLMNASPGSVSVPGFAQALPESDGASARRRSAVVVLSWLKGCSENEREAWVNALSAQFHDVVASARGVLSRALNWQEIAAMAGGGIEFGAHTVSHCSLTRLSPSQLTDELVIPKRRLEEALGTTVAALAYPFGGRASFNSTVIAGVRAAGYRVATTYIPGINLPESADRYALRRQHVERDTSRSYFEALVNAPELFD